MPPRSRLDAELVRRKMFASREQAAAAIAEGRVTVAGQPARKAATAVTPDVPIVLRDPDRVEWASRGAHKLLGALSDAPPSASQREQPFRPYAGVEDAESEPEEEEKPTIDLRNFRPMSGAIFGGAKTQGARLEGANLSGAILSDADLRNADLRGANLKGTILANADLRDVDLRDANLNGSILEGADFRGVKYPGLRLVGVIMPGYRFRGDKPEGATEGAEEQDAAQGAAQEYATQASSAGETDRPVVEVKAPSSSES